MKIECKICKEMLDPSEFSKKSNSKRGYHYKCKMCHNKYVREVWYPKNQQKHVASVNDYKKKNRAKVLAYRYGFPIEMVEKFMEKAKEECAICGEKSSLNLDHCHSKNIIRGYLCRPCNLGLGMFRDNISHLENAIKYLSREDLEFDGAHNATLEGSIPSPATMGR